MSCAMDPTRVALSPKLAKAPAATTPRTRSGWSIATRSAFTAPIEWPTTMAGAISSACITAAASAAKSRVR